MPCLLSLRGDVRCCSGPGLEVGELQPRDCAEVRRLAQGRQRGREHRSGLAHCVRGEVEVLLATDIEADPDGGGLARHGLVAESIEVVAPLIDVHARLGRCL